MGPCCCCSPTVSLMPLSPANRRFGGEWIPNGHMVAADARTAFTFSLSPGEAHDGPEGGKLLNRHGQQHNSPSLSIGRAPRSRYKSQDERGLGDTGVQPLTAVQPGKNMIGTSGGSVRAASGPNNRIAQPASALNGPGHSLARRRQQDNPCPLTPRTAVQAHSQPCPTA